MTNQVRAFARAAMWALPVWAVLLFLSTLTPQPDPQTEFAAFSDFVTTNRFLISHLIASITGAAIGSVGVVALMTYLQDTKVAGKAIAGMATTVLGNTLTTAVFGTAAFAQPAIGRMFQAGHQNAFDFYNEVYAAPLFITVILGLLLMIVGSVFTGIAIAGSGRFPRWAGWVYPIAVTGFVFGSMFFSLAANVFSALLIVATMAVAWRAARKSDQAYTSAEVSV